MYFILRLMCEILSRKAVKRFLWGLKHDNYAAVSFAASVTLYYLRNYIFTSFCT